MEPVSELALDPSKKLPKDIERTGVQSSFTARAVEFTIIKNLEPYFFPSKNIPRPWFILDQKPKENLILVLTIRLPGEFERWMYKVMSQQMSLSFLSGELCISPDVHPLICICCYLLVCSLSSKSII